MKKTSAIEREIKQITEDIESIRKKDSTEECKKEFKQIKFLKDVLNYLKTNPNAEFVGAELERVNARIKNRDNSYVDWQKNKRTKECGS